MAKLRAAFHTLGCKTNHYETDGMRQQFIRAGFEVVPFTEPADVYIVNTCTVTAEADRKSRQMLHRAKQVNPAALVVAVGCQVVLNGAAKWADLSLGNQEKSKIVEKVRAALAGQSPANESDPSSLYDEFGSVDQQSETRAYVKIEDGCNNACAYCAIPLARGRVRSRSREQIKLEARALAEAGYQELVLTGIHLCSYGLDLGLPNHAVMELALDLSDIPGIKRIRLGSLEPLSVTPAFMEQAGRNSKLCPHFHLSLQSGSDAVLAKMNRRYRTDDFRTVTAGLRRTFNNPGLTTDVIVGFPGETEEQFAESLAFCEEMAFSRMHIFRFSARQGTRAASMPDPVSPEEIGRRSQLMLELADRLAMQYHRTQVGHLHQILLEQLRPDGFFEAYTPEYVPVRLPAAPGLAGGQLITVRGVAAESDFLICEQT